MGESERDATDPASRRSRMFVAAFAVVGLAGVVALLGAGVLVGWHGLAARAVASGLTGSIQGTTSQLRLVADAVPTGLVPSVVRDHVSLLKLLGVLGMAVRGRR